MRNVAASASRTLQCTAATTARSTTQAITGNHTAPGVSPVRRPGKPHHAVRTVFILTWSIILAGLVLYGVVGAAGL